MVDSVTPAKDCRDPLLLALILPDKFVAIQIPAEKLLFLATLYAIYDLVE
jgi:hypothetical protein